MVLICNHPELVAKVIDKKWPSSEKLQSMKGYLADAYKIALENHQQTIQELL
jgi:hypothetical protein